MSASRSHAVVIVIALLAVGCGKDAPVQTSAPAAAPAAQAPAAPPAQPAATPVAPAAQPAPAPVVPAAQPAVPAAPAQPVPAPVVPAAQPAVPAAPAPPVPAPEAEANLTVASYEVPGLNDDLARQLAQALADNPNVVAARWDKPTGLFQVTYSAGCPHGLLMKLQTVAPAASLKGVGRRAGEMPEQGGCGSCPSKGSCGGEH